jgi:hypothetical protein
MRNREQAFRSSPSQAEEQHLVHRVAMVHRGHQQRIKENLARFRE